MARSAAGEIGTGKGTLGRFARAHSLRVRIIGLVIALVMPMLAFSGFAMLRLSNGERDSNRHELLSAARALSAAMDLKLKTATAALTALGTSRSLADNDIVRFYDQARRVAAAHHAWILLADPAGMALFSTREPLGAPSRSLRSASLVRAAVGTRSTQISGAFIGGSSLELQVSAYVPVMHGETVTYVLLMSFNMRELGQVLREQQLPESWTVQVMDRGNLIIARNRSIDAVAGMPAEPSLSAAAARDDGSIFTATDADGNAAIAALARSDFTGWTLAIMIPRAEIYAPFYRSLWEIGLAAGMLLLLGTVIAVLVGRSIAVPVRALSDAAVALGRGTPLPPMHTRINEVNDVATALVDAAARLADQSRERDTAEAALRRSEQRFRDIAEVSGDWVWETDREHRFSYFSGTHAQELDRNPQAMLGRTRWEIAGADADSEPFPQHRADLEARRPIRNFRFSYIAEDGKSVYFNVNGQPVFDEAGEFLGYRGTTTNETAIVETRSRAEHAETLLQDALDSISAGILIYDRDDRLVMANESWHQMYRKYLDSSPIGKTFEEFLREGLAVGRYAGAVGREEEWLAERLEQHRSGTGSLEQQVAGGRWFLITDRRMRNGGIAGLRVDITDLKTAQAALQESEERLDRAQQVAGIGSWDLDVATGKYLWSKEMFRIRGFATDAEQPTMKSLVGTIHEEDFPKVHAWLKQLRQGGAPSAVEFRIRRPDGEERIISSEGRASRDAKGVITRVTGTARDVTEARRFEAERQNLETQLRHSQKLEALGTLAGGIAHDLNNTLVPIVAMTKLGLKRAGDDAQLRQYFGMIHDAGIRARDLVKRVLAFSRKGGVEQREFSVADVVAEALAMLRATTPSTISVTSDIRPVPTFLGDPTQIHQVVVNLVTNAVQAIGAGAGTVSVTLSPVLDAARQKPPGIRLVVSDSGVGMDEATAQRIFEPFFTTKGVGEGTGLGLSMVHGIVTGHNGTIRVESRPGHGTRFIVDLPVATADQAATDTRIPA
jgi:PAS domain S-box-containing protein